MATSGICQDVEDVLAGSLDIDDILDTAEAVVLPSIVNVRRDQRTIGKVDLPIFVLA
jgi:hypothetical protein